MKYILIFFLYTAFVWASLHDAVKSGNTTLLSKSLENTPKLNKLESSYTALGLAVKLGHKDMVMQLLKAGANIHLGKISPLKEALLSDDSEIAALLVKAGAVIPDDLGLSGKGLVYDLLLKRLYKSTDFLIKQGQKFPKKEKINAFSLALSFAPISLIKTFINKGLDLDYEDPYLGKPIEIALRLQRHDVLKLLIKNEVEVNDSDFLEISVSHNDIESIKLLVKAGCRIDSSHQNLLMLAVKYGNLKIIRELSRAGADFNFEQNGQTALTESLKYNTLEITQWLLGLQLDTRAHEQAIFIATSQGDLATVALLAEKEVGLESLNKQGMTPLLYAYKTKQFEIAKYLLGFDVDIKAKDYLGENVLFKSIRFFQDEMLETLLQKGMNVQAKNRADDTALNFTIIQGNYKAFVRLLKAGARPDVRSITLSVSKGYERFYIHLKHRFPLAIIKDDNGNTLLHTAAKEDRKNLLKRLLLDGIDSSLANNRGETALHIAAKEGLKASCSLLLSFDSNISALDARDNKAMNIAFKYNHPKLGKWLQNYESKTEDNRIESLKRLQDSNATLTDINASSTVLLDTTTLSTEIKHVPSL